MLELRAVSRRWAGFGLHEITLRVPQGEYFVLLGPSGAGKSLLLELIAGFHAPDSGSILLAGRDVTHTPPEERGIGFVYQDSMLFPHRTPRQNIAYGPRLRRRPAPELAKTVERLAAMLGISRVLERDPSELSGGERQRVAIARALAVQPQLLLMDEPLGALDPLTQATLRSELKRLHREAGLTVLHVTHDQAEARELGRRVGVLDAGRLLQVGEATDIFERPGSAFVAEFTGSTNIYEGMASAHNGVTTFRSGGAELVSTSLVEGPARGVVRPENVLISTEPVRTSARNQLAGRVSSVERRGRVYAVLAEFDGLAMTAMITEQSLNELALAPGKPVYFSFKAHNLHLIASEPPSSSDRRPL
jgi:molybdate/tungstate transport system ATP-binding protein